MVGPRHFRPRSIRFGRGVSPPRVIGTVVSALALGKSFDAFHQVDAGATRRFGGTGLGLAIAHRLGVSQGGSISVASQLGVGRTFTLFLPVAAPTPLLTTPATDGELLATPLITDAPPANDPRLARTWNAGAIGWRRYRPSPRPRPPAPLHVSMPSL